MEVKACVRITDRLIAGRRRALRRYIDAARWKRVLKEELVPRSWRFLERATGLVIPVAAGLLLVYILTRGALPFVAQFGGFEWPFGAP